MTSAPWLCGAETLRCWLGRYHGPYWTPSTAFLEPDALTFLLGATDQGVGLYT